MQKFGANARFIIYMVHFCLDQTPGCGVVVPSIQALRDWLFHLKQAWRDQYSGLDDHSRRTPTPEPWLWVKPRPGRNLAPTKWGGRFLAPRVTRGWGASSVGGRLGGPIDPNQQATDPTNGQPTVLFPWSSPISRVLNSFLALVCPSSKVWGPVLGGKTCGPVPDFCQNPTPNRPPTEPD